MNSKLPIHRSYNPQIEFRGLDEVEKANTIELMNHPLVQCQMSLTKCHFDDTAYKAFIINKKQLWFQYDYGSWAFIVDGKFAGWGSLQFEQGDADLALVLYPNYSGLGKPVYKQIIEYAFDKIRLNFITILLSSSRKYQKVLVFQLDGELRVDGELFCRLLANHDRRRI